MDDQIIRKFKVERESGYTQDVDFSCYASIFDSDSSETNKGKLQAYLSHVFIEGVPETTVDLQSISAAPLLITKQRLVESDLIEYAKHANYREQGKYQHAIVQRYMMKHDSRIIASEIPVYDETLRGHIDCIRLLDNDVIAVCDFKPKAKDEKKASSQLVRYCHVLCKRTGIPIKDMRAYYFDDLHCYQVSLLS